MKFDLQLADGQTLTIEKSPWFGTGKASIGQTLIGKFTWRGKSPLRLKFNDGSEHTLVVKNHLLDPVPTPIIDGTEHPLARKLEKWETAVVCVPALLILFGGALPAGVGLGGTYLNFYVLRNQKIPAPLRWSLIGAVPIIGFIVLALISAVIYGSTHQDAASTAQGWNSQTRPAADVERQVVGGQ
jgi:hypothetical protein